MEPGKKRETKHEAMGTVVARGDRVVVTVGPMVGRRYDSTQAAWFARQLLNASWDAVCHRDGIEK